MTAPRSDEMGWGGEPPTRTDSDSGKGKRESQATAMVRLALEAGVELWHTPGGESYITISLSDHHREHHPIASRGTKDYLTRLFYDETGKAPNATALQAAIGTLTSKARFDGQEHEVHVRVAGADKRIYLDLADRAWRAVEVTTTGWNVVARPDVRFRRPRGMLPLPMPLPGGSIAELRPFVNVASDSDFALVVAWLLAALRPQGPYPIEVLVAEQGAAKTTTSRVQRRLVDPNEADVRRPPRNTEDLMIAATNGHAAVFDNISRISDELSDNLSVLATGGGFAVRQLFENREEVIFHAQRPIILNGISQAATRGDLLDRAMVIALPTIPDDKRRDEATFWREFELARPRILGALLDAVACGLRRLPDVHLESKPRMADFAMWSVAVEDACPWPAGRFLDAYTGNQQGAIELILDGSPVADLVRVVAPWSGTATQFLAELNKGTPEHLTKRKDWYSRPRQVSDELRRLAPALRKAGFPVELGSRRGKARNRVIEIGRVSASASSAASSGPDSLAETADAPADAPVASLPHGSAAASALKANVPTELRLISAQADEADEQKPALMDEAGDLDADLFDY